MFKLYREQWRKSVTFEGRSTRSDFSAFLLVNATLIVLISFLFALAFDVYANPENYWLLDNRFMQVYLTFILVTALPSIALSVRRAHDFNQSGWLVLLMVVSFVGIIFFIALGCLPSDEGENKYDS